MFPFPQLMHFWIQAKNGGSESTSTEDEAQQPRRTRRMVARASASKAAARRSVRHRKAPLQRDEGPVPAGSERSGVSEGGSFLAMIANAAVSVDGLRRVWSFRDHAIHHAHFGPSL